MAVSSRSPASQFPQDQTSLHLPPRHSQNIVPVSVGRCGMGATVSSTYEHVSLNCPHLATEVQQYPWDIYHWHFWQPGLQSLSCPISPLLELFRGECHDFHTFSSFLSPSPRRPHSFLSNHDMLFFSYLSFSLSYLPRSHDKMEVQTYFGHDYLRIRTIPATIRTSKSIVSPNLMGPRLLPHLPPLSSPPRLVEPLPTPDPIGEPSWPPSPPYGPTDHGWSGRSERSGLSTRRSPPSNPWSPTGEWRSPPPSGSPTSPGPSLPSRQSSSSPGYPVDAESQSILCIINEV